MSKNNRFNLIDEPWIPVVDSGKVSLKEVFSNLGLQALGGTPIQKISVTKLLLAIAQTAYTPSDDDDWKNLGVKGLSQKCLGYLEEQYDRFWLYGENPFLQMKEIKKAEKKSYNAALPDMPTENTTILHESQIEKPLDDSDKALLLVSLMGFSIGGQETDNSVVLTKGYQGKSKDNGKEHKGKPGPFLGVQGMMHSFLLGENLLVTIWFNMFTQIQINSCKEFQQGLGIAPWERMPEGEDCSVAKMSKNSLMGRLVPISKFCLFSEGNFHHSEGILYTSYKEGGIDPSSSVLKSTKELKVLRVDPEKRPWRMLTSMLNFMSQDNSKNSYECIQIKNGLMRARSQCKILGIWSGGLSISQKGDKQYVSGKDDFVDSNFLFPEKILTETWYKQLELEMKELERISKVLFSSICNYFQIQKRKGGSQAKKALNFFWQLCENSFQDLCLVCEYPEKISTFRKYILAPFVNKTYETFCPKETSRQLETWAECRPNLNKYLNSK